MTLQPLLEGIAHASKQEPALTKIGENISRLWPVFGPAAVRLVASDSEPDGADAMGPLSATQIFDATMLAAAHTDRPWIGGALAIQGAIRHLLMGLEHPLFQSEGECLAFCASEIGGNRPSAIETTLTESDGTFFLDGSKRWATLGPLASHLIVIASRSRDAERNHLCAVVVPTDRAGVSIEEMTIAGAAPASLRLPHSLIHLDRVQLAAEEILEGDGYSRFLKPYRTIEDAYGLAARAATLIALCLKFEAEVSEIDRLILLLQSLRGAVQEGLSEPASHLVVNASERLLPELTGRIAPRFPGEIRSWWSPGDATPVAATAKALRAKRALERISG